jgi:hypothetical protein
LQQIVAKTIKTLPRAGFFYGVDRYCSNCYNMGIDSNKEHEMFLLGLIVGIVVGAYLALVVIVHTNYFG